MSRGHRKGTTTAGLNTLHEVLQYIHDNQPTTIRMLIDHFHYAAPRAARSRVNRLIEEHLVKRLDTFMSIFDECDGQRPDLPSLFDAILQEKAYVLTRHGEHTLFEWNTEKCPYTWRFRTNKCRACKNPNQI